MNINELTDPSHTTIIEKIADVLHLVSSETELAYHPVTGNVIFIDVLGTDFDEEDDDEEETLPLIQKRALTNRQNIFIENALKYFLRCKTNCCEWILENYRDFKSEYLKSMLCLVLGFHGNMYRNGLLFII